MKPFQERVIVEKSDLDEKIEKLTKFLINGGIVLPDDERERLNEQLKHMIAYSTVLGQRINHF